MYGGSLGSGITKRTREERGATVRTAWCSAKEMPRCGPDGQVSDVGGRKGDGTRDGVDRFIHMLKALRSYAAGRVLALLRGNARRDVVI